MTGGIDIPARPVGRIDVFAVDLPAEAIQRFVTRGEGTDDTNAAWPLRAALGADFLDEEGVEAVRVGDLADIGLAGYLREGLGAADTEVAAHLETLEALGGHVLILRGPAYGGVAQTLRPLAPLTHVATFHEAEAAKPGPPLTSDSAEPSGPDPEDTESGESLPPGSGTPLPIIVGGLVAASVLVAVLSLALGR